MTDATAALNAPHPQWGLFEEYSPPPFSDPDTSLAAARRIEPDAATLRAKVLRFIQSRPHHGATDEEIQDALAMLGNTERPRRRELEGACKIRKATDAEGIIRKRPTRSGRSAVVWTAAIE